MKFIALISGLLLFCSVDAADISEWLKDANPQGYFPETGDYSTYPDACNESTCFHLVGVYYVTPTNKGMRRVAVFSEDGKYLGAYSGFNEMPIKLVGFQLVFPESEFGSSINFDGKLPPTRVYIDGEYFEFESMP